MDLSRVNYADNKTLSDAHIPEALKSLVGNDLLEAPTKSLAAQEVDSVLAKANLYDLNDMGDEFKFKVPPLKRPRKAKKPPAITAGEKWFHMPEQILTPEIKADLDVVRLRNHLLPRSFYKTKTDRKNPKFFQIGTVLPSADEPPGSRIDKHKRKKSLAEQMLEEDGDVKFTRRKFDEMCKSKKKRSRKRRR